MYFRRERASFGKKKKKKKCVEKSERVTHLIKKTFILFSAKEKQEEEDM